MTTPEEIGLTSEETRLAEQYVRVLDFMSRCAQAMDGGDWRYLFEKAHQLKEASGRFAKAVDKVYRNLDRSRPRSEYVRAAVAEWGRHYRAGRLLHPLGGE